MEPYEIFSFQGLFGPALPKFQRRQVAEDTSLDPACQGTQAGFSFFFIKKKGKHTQLGLKPFQIYLLQDKFNQ
ncbi:MAG: hypothetical protein HKN68_14480 [Saprospiraceae bacterium]|nr:hypothetical protein [Saprospiraceae bacterium]